MNKLKSIYASAYSATISIIIVVAVTIGAELSPSFKSWLAGFTGHHWVTKSWISILVFILFLFIFRLTGKPVNASQARRSIFLLQFVAILGFFAILGFYFYEFFVH
jgi:predicted Co/Zn/Cd cation transporter (cation efflux family)